MAGHPRDFFLVQTFMHSAKHSWDKIQILIFMQAIQEADTQLVDTLYCSI